MNNALPSILHLPVRPVRGFTADTDACQAFIEHRLACENGKKEREAEEARTILLREEEYGRLRTWVTAHSAEIRAMESPMLEGD